MEYDVTNRASVLLLTIVHTNNEDIDLIMQKLYFIAMSFFTSWAYVLSRPQRAEAILNKITNNINKTYTGLINVLQGFQKCIA